MPSISLIKAFQSILSTGSQNRNSSYFGTISQLRISISAATS